MSVSQQPLVLEGGSDESVGDAAKFGIVTVSDRASSGVYEDMSGPAILQFFHEAIKSRCAPPPPRRMCRPGLCC
jgi:molybdopterin adenylyltransferase